MWEGLERLKVVLFITIQAMEQQLPWRTVQHNYKQALIFLLPA